MKFNSPYEIEFPEPYEVEHNCFGYTYTKKDMDIFVELCNFVPYISSEITSYDGYEKKTKIKIAGFDSNGNHLPEVIVLNDEFDKMLWIRENWGFNCNIVPGSGVKDKIRYALQSTSKYATKSEDYSTTGWYEKDGKYIFLMPGDDEIVVQLDGKLQNYQFDRQSLTEKEYADIFMLMGNVAPNEIIQPLLAFAFLSPLNSFLYKAQREPKTILML